MSNHFTYEIDERNLKQKLKNFELEYKPEAWLKFQNQGLSQIKVKEPNAFIKAKVHFNKNLVLGLIFLLIIISISSVLFKIINIKNPINKNIISPKPIEISKKQNKIISPEIKSKIELKPVISKIKKDSTLKISENDTINPDTINKTIRVISKNGAKQSDKNLKLKKSDNDTKNKQNKLSEKKLKIHTLPNILPTLKTDTLIPDLK
jgi:hypothetical protein